MNRRAIIKELRRARRSNLLTKRINEINLWRQDKKVYITIPNSNPNETNRRYIRVEAQIAWGESRIRNTQPLGESTNE